MGNLTATFWRPWKKAGEGKLSHAVEVCCIWMLWGESLVEATLHIFFGGSESREPAKAKVPFTEKQVPDMPVFKVLSIYKWIFQPIIFDCQVGEHGTRPRYIVTFDRNLTLSSK